MAACRAALDVVLMIVLTDCHVAVQAGAICARNRNCRLAGSPLGVVFHSGSNCKTTWPVHVIGHVSGSATATICYVLQGAMNAVTVYTGQARVNERKTHPYRHTSPLQLGGEGFKSTAEQIMGGPRVTWVSTCWVDPWPTSIPSTQPNMLFPETACELKLWWWKHYKNKVISVLSSYRRVELLNLREKSK